MSPDEATPTRLIEEVVRLISTSFTEIVPPEAQLHFVNAQRELLIGIALVIEHNSQRSLRAPRRRPSRTSTATKPPRPAKVDLD